MRSVKNSLYKMPAFATAATLFALTGCELINDPTPTPPTTPVQSSSSYFGEIYNTEEDLPNCTAKREGKTAYVVESTAIYICSNGHWSKGIVVTPSSSSTDPTSSSEIIPWPIPSSSSFWPITPSQPIEPDYCFETWYGSWGSEQVNTGFDAGTQTNGYWFSYSDDADGGNSRIVWPTSPGNEYDDNSLSPIIDYCNGICGTYVLDKGSLDYDPFVGVGFNMAGFESYDQSAAVTANASSMGGIRVTYTSTAPISVELWSDDETIVNLNYDIPFVTLPKAPSGATKYLTWSMFKQAGWGKGKISGEETAKKLASIRFKIQGKSGTAGNFNITSIGPYDETCSGAIIYIPESSSSSSLPPIASSSSYVPYYGSDFTTWFGSDGVERIETGLDAGEDNSGYWYFETDNVDGGNSQIIWPVPLGNEWDDNSMAPVVEYCSGICGQYKLDIGNMYYDPYVSVAFDLGGRDWSANAIPVDASSMQGVCIAYTSDAAATLEMGLGAEMDAKIEYANPAVTLPKAHTTRVAQFSWKEFKQPSWARYGNISGTEAAQTLASLRFRIQAKTGSVGNFNIMSIGAYNGNCHGNLIATSDVIILNPGKIKVKN